jgi:hypothetical protein
VRYETDHPTPVGDATSESIPAIKKATFHTFSRFIPTT